MLICGKKNRCKTIIEKNTLIFTYFSNNPYSSELGILPGNGATIISSF